MLIGNHEVPFVGIPHSYGSPLILAYERGPISLAIAYAATTSVIAVTMTVTNKIKKFIYMINKYCVLYTQFSGSRL